IKWGIKQRVLFLALIPTITISILLGVYFIGIRLEDLSVALNDRGTAIASRLASQGQYGVFARDTESLRNLARQAISKEVTSVAFYDKKGVEIASAGKLMSNIVPPTANIGSVQIVQNNLNDTISYITPVTLPDVVIDTYPVNAHSMEEDALNTTVIGWMKAELDHKTTRLKEYQVLIHSALIGLLGLSISCLLALRLGYDVTQPILELTSAVEKIKNGDFATRVNSESHWELGILESGINTMASSLQIAREEMQHNVDKATADLRQTLKTIEIQNIELDLARKEAETATQVKSEFLASMSHELRTPLNGIVGFINLLDKTELTEQQHDYLSTIQKSGHSLLSIINDILDFSKIEAGKLHLDLMPMDIRECVEDTLTLLGPSAHDKALDLVPFIYSDVPTKINGDSLRLKQVLTNLVSNAIKFTQHGSVVIRVMLDQSIAHLVTLRISVTDTGIGISDEQKKELFNAFNQTSPNITRKFGGTGLGLVICKKLVEQMHGTIELESDVGKGTTFWFTFQAEKLADNTINEERELADIRVILYEKHLVTRLALAHLLQQWGIRVEECEYGDEIVNLAQQGIVDGDPFSMVILGINQPQAEMNLITQTIDNVKEPFACPVGVLVNTTEYGAHNDILQAGATLCLAKPISRKKLYDALRKIFITQPHLSEQIPAPLPSLNVLAVDDNPANLKLVQVFLQNIGVIPTLAKSGYEAIQYCNKNYYNLILMDLHMPGMDGIETAVQIRSTNNPNYNTAIVALSAHVLIGEQDKIIAAGMNDYLTKPIDENSLRASIYKWTHSGVISLSMEQNMEMANTCDMAPIDWQLCKKLAGNKEDLAHEMLDMLINCLPNDRAVIMQAYNANNMQDLREHVHKLHGACCYVGVPKLKALAKELEDAIGIEAHDKVDRYVLAMEKEIRMILDYHQNEFATA
ncbi:MAG TPA: response regulator, partial [Gammaproteobacteria bacterium]|nr:response regulator [Gammaproteobacteria bacterium]